MSVRVLVNLLNELEKRDKMRGLSRLVAIMHFNNTRARMLNSIYLSYDVKKNPKTL